MSPRRASPGPEPRGFTIVELLVVVAVMGLIVRVALLNLGAIVPSATLDSECKQMRAHIDFLRSEARLRGQAYSLELDLTNHRYRYILPPERKLASHEDESSEMPLSWAPLDEKARFLGVAVPSRPAIESGTYRITFDENGNTGDIAIFFKLQDAENKFVWTLQLRGLTGRADIKKSVDGKRFPLEEVNESGF